MKEGKKVGSVFISHSTYIDTEISVHTLNYTYLRLGPPLAVLVFYCVCVPLRSGIPPEK